MASPHLSNKSDFMQVNPYEQVEQLDTQEDEMRNPNRMSNLSLGIDQRPSSLNN
jgi:hypothetical protein